jgi:glycosyltransferase involved in cell wall biosynthesis
MHLGVDLLFLVPGRSGGREIYAQELLKAMRAVDPGLRVTTFVNAETREVGEGFWTQAADRCVALPRVRVASRPAWAAGELAGLSHAAQRAGIDLLHAPANLIPPWGDFVRVLTLHDLMFRRHPHLLTPAMRWGTELTLPLGARRAHLLLTGSAVAREEIVDELGIAPGRIEVVHHGIGGLTAPGDRARGRALLGDPDRPVAFAVGSDLPHKNMGAVLDGIAALAPEERPLLALAGHGTDGPALAERAAGLGLGPADARLLGGISHADLEDLYAAADVFVVTTRHEGFGLTVLEAMTRGVPVVCSDIPVLHEVAERHAVFVDQESGQSIAAGIRQVLADDGARERLRSGAREHAARFSWEAAARASLDAFRRALASARCRPA